jgi:hypothetical protein
VSRCRPRRRTSTSPSARSTRTRPASYGPSNCKWLNYEGEIAIVIGRTCRNVSHAEAGDYIAGYTVANDYGLHDFRDTDSGSMLRVKGADTLCPLGPGLVTDWDFRNKRIRTIVNGVVQQDDNTDTMAWDMHYLVADIARLITLVPGDVILSGTPAISRTVYPGDVVTVEVEGLGALTNTIVDGPVPVSDEVGAQPTETDEVLSTAMGGDWPPRGTRRPEATPREALPDATNSPERTGVLRSSMSTTSTPFAGGTRVDVGGVLRQHGPLRRWSSAWRRCSRSTTVHRSTGR